MDHHLLSPVGLRPGAVACGVATWIDWVRRRGQSPRSVTLITSGHPNVAGNAERLSAWMKSIIDGPQVDVHMCEVQSEVTGLVEGWEAAHQHSGNERHYLSAPGRKVDTIRNVLALGDSCLIWYSAGQSTVVLRANERRARAVETASVGLSVLLDVAGVEARIRDDTSRATRELIELLPPVVARAARRGAPMTLGSGLSAELAFELFGQLYLVLNVTDTKDPRVTERSLIQQLGVELRPLLPRILIIATDHRLRERLRSAGYPGAYVALPHEPSDFHAWSRPALESAWTLVDSADPVESRESVHLGPETLVVVLGSDPSATLTSIVSWPGTRVAIVYDSRSEAVRVVKERLIQMLSWTRNADHAIQPERVVWVECDAFGLRLNPGLELDGATVDITPGTVAQSLRLAGYRRADVRSQRLGDSFTDPSSLVRVTSDESGALTLRGPNLALQAGVAGGRLQWTWRDAQYLSRFGRFYRIYATELTKECALYQQGGSLSDLWPKGPLRSRVDAARLRHRDYPRGWENPADVMEQVVGWQLLDHGFDDVVVGMRRDWEQTPGPPMDQDDPNIRDEIDVAGRFGVHFVSIEVKTGASQYDALPSIAQTHTGRTRSCLQRFAIPIVVMPLLPNGASTMDGLACPVISWKLLQHRGDFFAMLDRVLLRARGQPMD